jgi:hypothetical protein
MVTAYTKMLLGMLQNRIEARLGQMIDTDRVLSDAVYASAVLSLARGTLNGEIRLLAHLLWPLVSKSLHEAGNHPLHGCPPTTGKPPRSARVLAFPRPTFA